MLFPTIDFGLFFALSLALIWGLNSRNELKKLVLLGLSLAFYASWNWRFLLLLLASAGISYLVGLYAMVCITLNTFDVPVPESPQG